MPTRAWLRVMRETDHGVEKITLPLPAVVTCDLRLNEPRYASLPAIMRARKKPLEQIELAEIGWTVEPRIEIVKLESVDSARDCQFVQSVEDLLARLRDEARAIP